MTKKTELTADQGRFMRSMNLLRGAVHDEVIERCAIDDQFSSCFCAQQGLDGALLFICKRLAIKRGVTVPQFLMTLKNERQVNSVASVIVDWLMRDEEDLAALTDSFGSDCEGNSVECGMHKLGWDCMCGGCFSRLDDLLSEETEKVLANARRKRKGART